MHITLSSNLRTHPSVPFLFVVFSTHENASLNPTCPVLRCKQQKPCVPSQTWMWHPVFCPSPRLPMTKIISSTYNIAIYLSWLSRLISNVLPLLPCLRVYSIIGVIKLERELSKGMLYVFPKSVRKCMFSNYVIAGKILEVCALA